jgi:hypothetical protein
VDRRALGGLPQLRGTATAAGAPHNTTFSQRATRGRSRAEIRLDDRQREIDPGGDARRAPQRAVADGSGRARR